MSEKKTCSHCGVEKTLDETNFRYREQDGNGYYTAECQQCIKKAKAVSEARSRDRREQGLSNIESTAVDLFVKATKQSGSNIPHTAELVEQIFRYFGGAGGFGAVLVKQYWDASPGGSQRNRLLETLARLVTKNVDSGGAKKPLQLWSEEELEDELNNRMLEAVASFKGVTIDATQEIEYEETSESDTAGSDEPVSRDDGLPKKLIKRNTGRTKGPKNRSPSSVSTKRKPRGNSQDDSK
jgi:hypothetical protein